MKTFHYIADTATGERVRGTLEAADEPAARQDLAARGLTVVALASAADADERIVLAEDQVSTLVQAVGAASTSRVPLEVTLAALAEEKDDPRLAKVARRLSDRLQRGETIDAAVAALDRQLPSEIRGLLRAGVESGDLAGTVERFAQQRIATQRTRMRIRTAIAYPLLIVAILVPLALFLSLFVIPIFRDMFAEFELELPAATELVLETTKQMPTLIFALLLLLIGLPIVLRAIGGRWMLHRVRSASPLVGRLWTWSGQREFAAMLASFLDQRLPLASAIALTGDVLSDRNVARACRRVNQRLEQGQPLSGSLGQSIHFDRSLVALVAWGEQHGLLADALRIAAAVFDDRIAQHSSFVRRLLPPITMVVVAAAVLLVVLSLMLPLVNLIEGLSG